jgi:transcription antitermination factor NusG
MTLEWFVFYTFPKAEKVIKKELEKVNLEVCLPLQKVTRQWKDRRKVLEIPLFPNYIFVKTFKSQVYHIVNNPKVVRYVAFEGRPATLKEEEVDFIRYAGQCNNIYLSHLKKGDKIRISSGVLQGYEGILAECDGKKKFGLVLKEINQMIFVDLTNTKYEKVTAYIPNYHNTLLDAKAKN